MTELRVALFPADQTGCGTYRMLLPAQAAAKTGVTVTIPESLHIRRRTRDYLDVTDANVDADVVVLQRPAHLQQTRVIPHLQRRGIAVVVDVDDDMAALHAAHPAFQELHPSNELVNWHHLKRCCQLADLVTVTTPALAARYGRRDNTIVLPNYVPASMLEVTADRDGRTVGWGGSTVTHVGDLAVTRGGVAQAIASADARFLLVGQELEDAQRQLGLLNNPDTTGYVPFAEYPRAIAQFDVGIVPLVQNAFNAAKSALKGLEYAALGVPFVASPTQDYQRLAAQGIGLLASDRARDWRRHVRRLLTDPSFRDETAGAARAAVTERHLYERNGHKWAEAWSDALAARRAASRRAA